MDFFNVRLFNTVSNSVFGSDLFVIFIQILSACFISFLFFATARIWKDSLSYHLEKHYISHDQEGLSVGQTDFLGVHDDQSSVKANLAHVYKELTSFQEDLLYLDENAQYIQDHELDAQPKIVTILDSEVPSDNLYEFVEIQPAPIKAKLQISKFPIDVLNNLEITASGDPEEWFWHDYPIIHSLTKSDGSYDMVWQQYQFQGIIAIAIREEDDKFIEFSIPPKESFYAFDVDDISLEESWINSEYGAKDVLWYKNKVKNQIIIRVMHSDLVSKPIADCIFRYRLFRNL